MNSQCTVVQCNSTNRTRNQVRHSNAKEGCNAIERDEARCGEVQHSAMRNTSMRRRGDEVKNEIQSNTTR